MNTENLIKKMWPKGNKAPQMEPDARMKSASQRYGLRAGCRYGQPHDFVILGDTKAAKFERCQICGVRKVWSKFNKGRIDNVAYLQAHVRNFAQPIGSTKTVFNRLYHPEKCVIKI
jgi:hypothetical protein